MEEVPRSAVDVCDARRDGLLVEGVDELVVHLVGRSTLHKKDSDCLDCIHLISRADRKSQVRQCLGFCLADSKANEDQNQL